jgi:predicted outer membrane repeat protein
VTLSNNAAPTNGGALATDGLNVTMDGGAFEDNTAGYMGGA